MRVNMNVGLSGPLDFDPDTILTSCIFYWGEYSPTYPYDSRGHKGERNQIEFRDIQVRDLQWIIDQMRLIESKK